MALPADCLAGSKFDQQKLSHEEDTREPPEPVDMSFTFVVQPRRFPLIALTLTALALISGKRYLFQTQEGRFPPEPATWSACQISSSDKYTAALHLYPGESLSITHLYPSVAEVIQVIGASSVLNNWAANIGARDGVSHGDEIFELYNKLQYTGIAVEADAAFKVKLKENLPDRVK